jgi:hypothetical protein
MFDFEKWSVERIAQMTGWKKPWSVKTTKSEMSSAIVKPA